MFTTSAICSRRHRLEVDLHPRRKENVIIIYTQSQISRSRQPNEPELRGSCLDIRWRRWFLRWSFLIWTFLYRSLSSRSLYASGYSHVNKTHFHKKGLTLLITSRYFGSRKGPILSWRNGILFVVLSGADWGRCKRLDSLRAGFRHRCGFWLDEIFFLEESKNSVSKNTDSFAVYTCNCLRAEASTALETAWVTCGICCLKAYSHIW